MQRGGVAAALDPLDPFTLLAALDPGSSYSKAGLGPGVLGEGRRKSKRSKTVKRDSNGSDN